MSAVEDKARQGGWVDKDEWVEQGKEADEWVTAGEFNRRGELLGFIRNQNKQLNELRKTVHDLNEHNARLEQIRLQEKRREIEHARRTAIKEGDAHAVEKLDEANQEIRNAEAQIEQHLNSDDVRKQLAAVGAPLDTVEALQEFKQHNEWYGVDMVRTAAFNAKAEEMMSQFSSARDMFKEANKAIADVFEPKAPRREKTVANSTVDPKVDPDATTGKGSAKPKYTEKNLTPDQLSAARRMIRSGAFQDKDNSLSESDRMQKYVDQLADAGVFDNA